MLTGYRYPRYCKFTEDNGIEILSTGKTMARGIKADIKITTSDAKAYSDDGLGESMKEFISGTMTQENDDVSDEVLADLTGATFEDGELTAGGNDNAPYCRVGFIVRRIKNNVVTFRATVFMKVKYGIPDESYETQGENIAFKSSTIVGDIFRNVNGAWKKQKLFPTLEQAVKYLNSKLNMSIPELTITSVAGTAVGTTKLTVSPTLTSGNSYMVKTGTTVIAPETDDVCNAGAGYTAWGGTADIPAASGNEVVVVEVDSLFKAVKAGKTTVTAKE